LRQKHRSARPRQHHVIERHDIRIIQQLHAEVAAVELYAALRNLCRENFTKVRQPVFRVNGDNRLPNMKQRRCIHSTIVATVGR
jgi:hypothetical protein